jgi:hypothetical protein
MAKDENNGFDWKNFFAVVISVVPLVLKLFTDDEDEEAKE